MPTTCLETVCSGEDLVCTRVSSEDRQMSLAGVGTYEVQCIIGNGDMGTPL